MLDIAGTLTMGADGEITNSNGDYSINEDGMNLERGLVGKGGYEIGRSVTWGFDGDDKAGMITTFADDSTPTLDEMNIWIAAGYDHSNLMGTGKILMEAQEITLDADETLLGGNLHAPELIMQDNETRTVSGTGEQSLSVGNSVVGVSTPDGSPAICRIDLSGLSPTSGQSYSFVIINDGGNNFFFRDESSASLSGSNIQVAGRDEREIQPGGRLAVTYFNGNYHLTQDRD